MENSAGFLLLLPLPCEVHLADNLREALEPVPRILLSVFSLTSGLASDEIILPLFASVFLPLLGLACHFNRRLFGTGPIVYFEFNKLSGMVG